MAAITKIILIKSPGRTPPWRRMAAGTTAAAESRRAPQPAGGRSLTGGPWACPDSEAAAGDGFKLQLEKCTHWHFVPRDLTDSGDWLRPGAGPRWWLRLAGVDHDTVRGTSRSEPAGRPEPRLC
jgi:hypothetical protein